MQSQKILETLSTPAVVAILGATGAYLIFGESGKVQFPIVGDMNALLGVGIVTGGSALIGEVSKNYILPYLPNNSQYSDLESKAISPVVSGVLTAAFLYPILDSNNLWKAVALGAGSEIVGSYVTSTVSPVLFPN